MKKRQLAVEWFAEELNRWRVKNFGEDSIIGIPEEVLQKAVKMEEDNISVSYVYGSAYGIKPEHGFSPFKYLEQVYGKVPADGE
jgi:hypothetical protein